MLVWQIPGASMYLLFRACTRHDPWRLIRLRGSCLPYVAMLVTLPCYLFFGIAPTTFLVVLVIVFTGTGLDFGIGPETFVVVRVNVLTGVDFA